MATRNAVVLGLLLITLVVDARIRFDTRPLSAGVLLGQDLLLDCAASDMDGLPLEYHWEFNNTPTTHQMLPNNSLFIAQVARADLGVYRCLVQLKGQPTTSVPSPAASVAKAYINDFFSHPVSATSVNGTAVSLECVTGYSAPPAIVHWEKDGVIFTEGTEETGAYGAAGSGGALRMSMKLSVVAVMELEGQYACAAENPLTKEMVRSAAANLTVKIPDEAPVITIQPDPHPIGPASLPFTLVCGVRGHPQPEIHWFRGDAVLADSSRILVLQNGSLHFAKLREEDSGMYKCSAANKIGAAVSDTANLTVAVLDIDFTRSPSDINVLGGQPVTLLCVPPRSIPPARMLWYRNSEPFVPRGGEFAANTLPDGSLYFKNIQMTDEGQYFCVAVNDEAVPATRTSEKATITVQASPRMTEPPVPQRITKGRLLTLTCRVQGRPKPTIRWFKDNEELVSGDRVSFQNLRMELLVADANKDDEGMYRCLASNRLGNVSSASVLVFVVIPPEIVRPPQDTTMRAGMELLVPCRVYGDPTPTITWFKNGAELVSRARINITRDGVVISNAQLQDEGTYECRAVNEGGRKTASGQLRIEVAPVLTIYPEDKSVPESQPLVLYCEGRGYPPPDYHWMFNGSKTLPTDFELHESGRQLVVQVVSRSYSGTYTCVAENVAGQDSHSVSVLVTVRPQITTILGDLEVDQGDDLHLTCVVSGSPPPGVTWFLNGVELLVTSDARVTLPAYNELRVRFVRGDNSGRYQCVAQNEAGIDKLTTTVRVLETPLPPTLTSVHAVSMTSVNMSWEASADDVNSQVTSWVVQYKERVSHVFVTYRDDIPANLRALEVSGLRPFTEYSFRVAARNQIGTGMYSAVLAARTLESAPSRPRNLIMESHNATAVSLRWELPAETNGVIRAYQVHFRRKYKNDEFQSLQFDESPKTLLRHVIGGLDPYTTYEIKVRGATIEQSRYLWGEFSKPIDITTSAALPSAAPPGVTVRVLSSRAISVSWQALPAEYQQGLLRGYIVTYARTDKADDIEEQRVLDPATQTNLSGLLPWRYYDIRVAAYNQKGRGVPSDVISVRTNPEVPTGRPSDVQVAALSDSTISVKWQPIPVEERNSEISGYVVEYENTELPDSDTLSQDIGDPGTHALNITGLLPWTKYRVRVRGFTTQLSQGFGPSSDSIVVTTLEGVPGPVQNLTVNVFATSALLTWLPPEHPNGVISSYVVIYNVVTFEVIPGEHWVNPAGQRLVRRDVGVLVGNETWELRADDTNVTVTGLRPESAYAFTVVAETAAGRPATSKTNPMATVVLPPLPQTVPPTTDTVTRDVTTAVAMIVATDDVTTVTPLDKDVDIFPYILGGSIAGAILVLTLIIIAVVFCCIRQKNRKGIYYDRRGVIPPPAFAQETLADMQTRDSLSESTSDRSQNSSGSGSSGTQVPSSGSGPTRTTSAGTHSSIAIREARPGPSMTGSSAISRPLSEAATASSEFPRGIPLDPMFDLTYSSLDDLRVSHLSDGHYRGGLPPLYLLPPQVGLENPAYEPESIHDLSSAVSPHTESSILRSNTVYTSQHDLYAQVNLSKRRKNRMKSQTAAAIAAQKNATSSMFLDTDALINNDSVVVYDERTAL